MSKNKVAIIESIKGRYIAVDEEGNVRVLKKGDVIYENEEVRFDGKQPNQSFQNEALNFDDIISGDAPFLLIHHIKSATSHLISYTEYIYFDSDISGSDSTTSSTTLTSNRLTSSSEDISAGTSTRGGNILAPEKLTLTSSKSEASIEKSEEQAQDIMQTIIDVIDEKLSTPNDKIDVTEQTQDDTIQEILDDPSEDTKTTIRPNVPPAISSGDFDGNVKEIIDLDPKENNSKISTSGKIAFTDENEGDTHTVTSSPQEDGYKGDFTVEVENGEIVWDFSVDDSDLDSLKEGETLTQTYTITLDDGNGGTTTKDITVTINGTNDAPTAQDVTTQTNQDEPITGNVLTNASDIDGDDLHVSEVDGNPITNPITTSHGSIVMNEDGSYTFTPDMENEEIQALDSTQSIDEEISFTIDDGNGGTVTQTLTITITGQNDTPTIGDGDLTGTITEKENVTNDTTSHTTSGKIPFADNDTNDTHTVTSTPKGGGYKGEFSAKVENGEIVWELNVEDKDLDTLKEGESLTQTYTITLDDGNGGTVSKDVSVTINGKNDTPLAQDDTVTTPEDTQLTGNIIDNDSDIDADPLQIIGFSIDGISGDQEVGKDITILGKGTININADGSYTFTPITNYHGSIPTITYTLQDDKGGESTAVLDITVGSVNDNPIANDDTNTINEDEVASGNILANDTDIDNNNLSVTSFSIGSASFTPSDTPVDVIENGKTIGKIKITENGEYEFTPSKDFNGDVPTITYHISDGHGGTSLANLSLHVNPLNDAPITNPDTTTILEDHPATGNVITNDTDVDGDTLHVTSASIDTNGDGNQENLTIGNPVTLTDNSGNAIGIFVINDDGSYIFNPAQDYEGDVPQVSYTVSDGTLSDSSTLDINITPVEEPPTANEDKKTIKEDSTLNGNVLSNDTDPDGNDTIHVSSATIDINGDGSQQTLTLGTPTNLTKNGNNIGTITLNEDGTFTFIPETHYHDEVPTLNYTITDDTGKTSSSTLDINIDSVNDAPVANPDVKIVTEDTKTTGNILENDTDVDSDTLYVKSAKVDIDGDGAKEDITIGTAIAIKNASGEAIGTFKLDPDGTYTFDPAPDYTGSVPVIDYTATDGKSDTSSTLTLTIYPVNDAPVLTPDTNTVAEDTTASGNVLTNDTDAENETLSVKSATMDINGDGNQETLTIDTNTSVTKDGKVIGEITLNSNGTYTFVPTPDYNGDVPQITYTATDGTNDVNSTLDIKITPTDDGVTLSGLDSTSEISVSEANLATIGSSPSPSDLSKSNSFSFTSVDGLKDIDIGGYTFTLADLKAFDKSQSIDTSYGKIVFDKFTGDEQGGTIEYTYTLTKPVTNANPDDTSFSEDIHVIVTDKDNDTSTDTINITIQDDTPTASNDTNAITEDTTSVDGNIITNDTKGADGATIVTQQTTGNYGSVKINADGTYTYTLDNTNLDVQDLTTGENLTDTFTYTIKDGDGDTKTATLTITIDGKDDGVELTLPTDNQVYESGLSGGSEESTDKNIVNDSFTLKANDGLDSIIIGTTKIQKSDIEALDLTHTQSIDTGEGTLLLNSYTKGTDGTITIGYKYTLNNSQTHPNANANNEIIDNISITVNDTDSTADTITQTLAITIVDDTPTAKNDTNAITEDNVSITDNVITNDTKGADGVTISEIKSGSTTQTAGSDLTGTYGKININANGEYKYTLDNSNATVQALGVGDTLTEAFTYTIKDGDGDTKTATLTITINGADDGVSITGLDATQEHEVSEANLSTGSDSSNPNALNKTGNFSFTCNDGLEKITIHGEDVTAADIFNLGTTNKTITTDYGTIALTSFTGNEQGGKIEYTYKLTTTVTNANATDTSYTENITVVVSDVDNDTSTDFINVKINDDAPVAKEDAPEISEDNGVENTKATGTGGRTKISGNALDNDTLSADRDVEVLGINKGSSASVSETHHLNVSIPGSNGYGVCSIKANGEYTYFLSDHKLEAQHLTEGQTVEDVFTYFIKDKDGDISQKTLTVTIHGTDDDVTLNIIDSNNTDIGHQTVKESGLLHGSSQNTNDITASGTFTLTALDGLKANDAIVLNGGNGDLALTKTQVEALSSTTTQTLDTTEGTLVLNGYAQNSDTGEITIDYTYTLKNAVNHTPGADYTDDISITVTDRDSDVSSGTASESATQTLSILIIDDAPTTQEITLDEDRTDFTFPANADVTTGNTNFSTQATHGTATVVSDGTIKYVPNANYSGDDTFTYVTSVGGIDKTVKVTVHVNPVSDAPTLGSGATNTGETNASDVIVEVNEDEIVAFSTDTDNDWKLPVITDDRIDAGNNSTSERMGLITIEGIPKGATLYYDGNSYEQIANQNITIKISNVANYHINNLGTPTLTLTQAQFEGLKIKPPEHSSKDMNLTLKVTEYEVDSSGNKISTVDGAESSQTIKVVVKPVTDGDNFTLTKGTAPIGNEDSGDISGQEAINLKDAFTFKESIDADGSEHYTLSFSGDGTNSLSHVLFKYGDTGTWQSLSDFNSSNHKFFTDGTGGSGANTLPDIYVKTLPNNSQDIKGLTLKLTIQDHDEDDGSLATTGTNTGGGGTLEKSATLDDIKITPVANDITLKATTQEGNEDTLIDMNLNFTKTDSTDDLTTHPTNQEVVDYLIISDIPEGAKIYKSDGTTLVFESTNINSTFDTHDIANNTNLTAALTEAEIKALKILPPQDFSGNITLSVKVYSKDTDDDSADNTKVSTTPEFITAHTATHTIKVNGIVDTSADDSTVSGKTEGEAEVSDKGHLYVEIKDIQVSGDSTATTTFDHGTEDTPLDLKMLWKSYEHVDHSAFHGTTPTDKSETAEFIIQNQSGDTTAFIIVDGLGTDGHGAGATQLGVKVSGGWKLTAEELAKAHIKPQKDYSGTIKLELVTTVTDGTDKNTQTDKFEVTFSPVTDTPRLQVTDIYAKEDTSTDFHIYPQTTDVDGSEEVTKVKIEDIPIGAKILNASGDVIYVNNTSSKATHTFTIGNTTQMNQDGNDATSTLTDGDLKSLQIQAPPQSNEDFTIVVSPTVKEKTGGTEETKSAEVTVHVTGDADTPVLTNTDTNDEITATSITLTSDERTPDNAIVGIKIPIITTTIDTDDSESIAYVLENVPSDLKPVDSSGNLIGSFAGLSGGKIKWTFTQSEVENGLYLQAPELYSGNINDIKLTSWVIENDGDAQSKDLIINLNIKPVVNTTSPVTTSINGLEDATTVENGTDIGSLIKLNFNSLADSSEQVTEVSINALPNSLELWTDKDGFWQKIDSATTTFDSSYIGHLAVGVVKGGNLENVAGDNVATISGISVTLKDIGETGNPTAQTHTIADQSITVSLEGVADQPEITNTNVVNPVPSSDTSNHITVTTTFPDENGGEEHYYIISTDESVTLNEGVYQGNGTWYLTKDQVNDGFQAWVQGDSSTTQNLTISAYASENGTKIDSKTVQIKGYDAGGDGTNPTLHAQTPDLVVNVPNKNEDSTFTLADAVDETQTHLNDSDNGSETLSFIIRDLPTYVTVEGAKEFTYIENGVPITAYRVDISNSHPSSTDIKNALESVVFTPTENFSGTINFTLDAVANEPQAPITQRVSTTTKNVSVTINPIVDNLNAQPTGDFANDIVEDTTTPITLNLASTDTDGSESVDLTSVTISVNEGSLVNASGTELAAAGANLIVNVDESTGQAYYNGQAVSYKPPNQKHGNFEMSVATNLTDGSDTATKTDTISITVVSEPDNGNFIIKDGSGNTISEEGVTTGVIATSEDIAFEIDISSNFKDTDNSELQTVFIENVPKGTIFKNSSGTSIGELSGYSGDDAIWKFSKEEVDGGIFITPPTHYTESKTLKIIGLTMEKDNFDEQDRHEVEFTLNITPVANGATILPQNSQGNEDEPILIKLNASQIAQQEIDSASLTHTNIETYNVTFKDVKGDEIELFTKDGSVYTKIDDTNTSDNDYSITGLTQAELDSLHVKVLGNETGSFQWDVEVSTTDGTSTSDPTSGVVNLQVDTVSGDDNPTPNPTTGAETIYGHSGNDAIDGKGGGDSIYGGSGDDTIVFYPEDVLVDGGIGEDTLQIKNDVDFNAVTTEIQNIEIIDLSLGDVTINNLSVEDVKKMTDSENTLKIDGQSGDTVNVDITTGWIDGGTANGYHTFTKDGATLEIKDDINYNIVA